MVRLNTIPQKTSEIVSDFTPANYTPASATLNAHLAAMDITFGSLESAFQLRGTWNALTNTPDLTISANATPGSYYVVSVAGTTSIGGIAEWKIGDQLFVGASGDWYKIDNTDSVTSVHGRAGAVVGQLGDYDTTEIAAPGTATNYTPAGPTLQEHLSALDTVLGGVANLADPTDFTAAVAVTPVALTDAATININGNLSNNFYVTINGNRTLAFSNLRQGAVYNLFVTQGAGAPYTLNLSSVVAVGVDGLPILSIVAGKTDWLAFMYFGTKLLYAGGTLGFTLP